METDTETTQIYRTVFEVEVFSRGPLEISQRDDDPFGLLAINYEIVEGACLGYVTDVSSEPVPVSELEAHMLRVGNDGSFFDDVIETYELEAYENLQPGDRVRFTRDYATTTFEVGPRAKAGDVYAVEQVVEDMAGRLAVGIKLPSTIGGSPLQYVPIGVLEIVADEPLMATCPRCNRQIPGDDAHDHFYRDCEG